MITVGNRFIICRLGEGTIIPIVRPYITSRKIIVSFLCKSAARALSEVSADGYAVKVRKTTTQTASFAKGVRKILQRKETMIFREVILGTSDGMIVPSPSLQIMKRLPR